jgi:pimeloyl-ACP methyl ester carboxylesterase
MTDNLDSQTSFYESGSGEPLLLIHGVGLNKQVWDAMQGHFSAGFRVISYDTLGHGESPVPPASVCLDDYLDQLLELIDALGLHKVTLCGHSMGALIAVGFALKYPERTRAIVGLMCAFNRSVEHQLRQSKVADLLAGPDAAVLLESTLGRWFTDNDYANPERNAKIDQVRHWLQSNNKTGYSRAYRVLAANGETYIGKLAGLAAPALFITAADDLNSTAQMCQQLADQVQRGEARVIPGERHMGQFLAPQVFLPVMAEFLQKLPGTVK